MKIMSVVGARPNFMKVAPIISAIQAHNAAVIEDRETIHHVLVHTGQHYDKLMSDCFFADLGLPKPDIHLGVGSGSHAGQTAEVMRKFEPVLLQESPDVLVVVGDVNSTLACALVAAKVSWGEPARRPVIAHVEAGLRSRDRAMPEEINRILTDHLADILFVTEKSGQHNLASEGVAPGAVHFVGNTMIDSLLAHNEKAERSGILETLQLREADGNESSFQFPLQSSAPVQRYILLTLHRPSNVDDRDCLLNILEGLSDLRQEFRIVFPAHPRTRKRLTEFGLEGYFRSNGGSRGIHLVEPLGYLDFLCLMKHAALVVTDSGGIQEETTCLGVPCVTVRENTERPVTVECGTNTLGGIGKESIRRAVERQLARSSSGDRPEKWDGKAGVRIVETLIRRHSEKRTPQAVLTASVGGGPEY